MVHLTNDGSNKAKVSLVDVWAGVSAFSEGFHDQSHVIVVDFFSRVNFIYHFYDHQIHNFGLC